MKGNCETAARIAKRAARRATHWGHDPTRATVVASHARSIAATSAVREATTDGREVDLRWDERIVVSTR